jgi:hypothetical protein
MEYKKAQKSFLYFEKLCQGKLRLFTVLQICIDMENNSGWTGRWVHEPKSNFKDCSEISTKKLETNYK